MFEMELTSLLTPSPSLPPGLCKRPYLHDGCVTFEKKFRFRPTEAGLCLLRRENPNSGPGSSDIPTGRTSKVIYRCTKTFGANSECRSSSHLDFVVFILDFYVSYLTSVTLKPPNKTTKYAAKNDESVVGA